MPLPHDPGPHWGEVGIHGLHRPREWDVVMTVEADVEGDEVWFVVLADGRIVDENGAAQAGALATAITIAAPFRAHAVRRAGRLWAVAARRIETVQLDDDPGGNAIELSWDGEERAVRVDGAPTLAGVPELERLGSTRYATFVVTANRLEGRTWEVAVAAL